VLATVNPEREDDRHTNQAHHREQDRLIRAKPEALE